MPCTWVPTIKGSTCAFQKEFVLSLRSEMSWGSAGRHAGRGNSLILGNQRSLTAGAASRLPFYLLLPPNDFGSPQQRLALFYLHSFLDCVVLICLWAKSSAVDIKALVFLSHHTQSSCPLRGSRLAPGEQVAPKPFL